MDLGDLDSNTNLAALAVDSLSKVLEVQYNARHLNLSDILNSDNLLIFKLQ
jgi:hypothetical protein